MDKKFCIVGAGGFARDTFVTLVEMLAGRGWQITPAEHIVFMELDANYSKTELMGVPVIRESEFDVGRYQVAVGIADPEKRKEQISKLPRTTEFVAVVHPSAALSQWVKLAEGCIITAGAVLTCNINIGTHAQIGQNATIGHDCTIGNYFTAAPGATINGSCTIGDGVYIGSNACVRQGTNIRDNVTIGMGSVVLNNIDEPGVYAGNPIRPLGNG